MNASSFLSFLASAWTRGCSNERAKNCTLNKVSGRVVNTLISSSVLVANLIVAPDDSPIQFFCITLTFSGQSSSTSQSFARSLAYLVIPINHCSKSRFSTFAPDLQDLPSESTCSLARTVWSTGSQLICAFLR